MKDPERGCPNEEDVDQVVELLKILWLKRSLGVSFEELFISKGRTEWEEMEDLRIMHHQSRRGLSTDFWRSIHPSLDKLGRKLMNRQVHERLEVTLRI